MILSIRAPGGHPELVGQKRDQRLVVPEIPRRGDGVVADGRPSAASRMLDGTIPVIICSGFSKEGELSGLKNGGPAEFLRRPFRRAELAATVAEALRERSRHRSVQE